MELTVAKENLQYLCARGGTSVPVEGAAEMIVPDTMPDVGCISRCLCRFTGVSRVEKEGEWGLSATAVCTVLYPGEDGRTNALTVSVPLRGSLPGEAGETVVQDLRLRRVDCTVPNSRKVAVRVAALLTADRFGQGEACLPLSAEAPDVGVEQDVHTLSLCGAVALCRKDLNYSDELELPEGMPAADTVLGIRVRPRETEYKAVAGKLVVKATLGIEVCYLADGQVKESRFHTPFTQVVDCAEVTEEVTAAVEIAVLSADAWIPEGTEGRIFGITLTGETRGIVFREWEIPVLRDAYSTTHALTAERQKTCLCGLWQKLERTVTLPETVGEIGDAHAEVSGVSFGEQKICVEVSLWGGDGVSRRMTGEIPVEAPEGACVTAAWLRARVETAEISGAGETRAAMVTVQAEGLLFASAEEELISSVEAGDALCRGADTPSVTVRRVRKGERFFEVGKAYAAPLGELFAANGMEAVPVAPEDRLILIPR